MERVNLPQTRADSARDCGPVPCKLYFISGARGAHVPIVTHLQLVTLVACYLIGMQAFE